LHALDIAAGLLGLLLLAYFCATARYAVSFGDETSYYAISQRFLAGDSPITDEWHLTQFSYILNMPLYSLYTALTGGTEGIVLFFRLCFAVTDVLFFDFMYISLRRYGAAGLAASFLFCALIPYVMLAYSYITYAVGFMMLTCLLLFRNRRPENRAIPFFAGIAFALAILSEPPLILLYICWAVGTAVLFAVRKTKAKTKTEPTILLPGTFIPVTAACVSVFAGFMIFLYFSGSFQNVKTVLPYLFSGREYNSGTLIQFETLRSVASFFGSPWLIGLCVCFSAAVAVKLFFRRRRAILTVFLLSVCFLAACYIQAAASLLSEGGANLLEFFAVMHNVPLILFAPIPFLLSKKQDGNLLGMLIAGEAFTVPVDLTSRVMLGSGGFLVRVPALLQTAILIKELAADGLRNGNKEKTALHVHGKKAAVSVLAGLCAALCLCWNAPYVWLEGAFKLPDAIQADAPLTETLTAGPMKHLITTPSVAQKYNNVIADLDTILTLSDGPVAVLDAASFAYIYLDRPVASFSVWYKREWSRLTEYWRLPYTQKPEFMYIPFYANGLFDYRTGIQINEQLANLNETCDVEVIRGKAGYIIRVISLFPE